MSGDASPSYCGSCVCGALRYSVCDRGFRPYACHCKDCQTKSGSAFAITLHAQEDDIQTLGEVMTIAMAGLNDAMVMHHLCPACLTRIYSTNSLRPGMATVRAGTRDDSPELVPAFHIWVSRKQPWLTLSPDVLQFDRAPDDPAEWRRLVRP